MKYRMVFRDWRRIGHPGSIYCSPLGVTLSAGDLHGGSTFEAEISLSPEISAEIWHAYKTYSAYPVFALLPENTKENTENHE